MHNKKGFMLILILQVTAVVMTSAVAIIALCSDQIRQARTRNDSMLANYAAFSGAERMFTRLKSLEGTSVNFPITLTGTVSISDQNLIGNYTVTADTVSSDTLGIVSTGNVGGRSSIVTAKYGYTESASSPMTLISNGYIWITQMDLNYDFDDDGIGDTATSYIEIDGPIESSKLIGIYGNVTVNPPDSVHQNNQSLQSVNFWLGDKFDTNNDGKMLQDRNGDGYISPTEAQVQIAENPNLKNVYDNDDIDGDLEIEDRDAFIYYYTQYYTEGKNNPTGKDLGLNPGGENYYQGDTSIGGSTFDAEIIFVDGAYVYYYGNEGDNISGSHTIISTGFVHVIAPSNEIGDNLVIIADGPIWIYTLPEPVEPNYKYVNGNIVAYSHDHVSIMWGGHYNGSIGAKGGVSITAVGQWLDEYTLTFNKFKGDWQEANLLGVPPSYPAISGSGFTIDTSVKPKWERN